METLTLQQFLEIADSKDMNKVFMLGRRGSGKTIAAGILALEWPGQREICSNFPLDGLDVFRGSFAEMLELYPEHLCVYDVLEWGYRHLFSRSFIEYAVAIWGHKSPVIVSSQFPQMMDLALLEQFNWFIRTRLENDTLTLRISDYWGHYTGDMSRKAWPVEQFDYEISLDARPYFDRVNARLVRHIEAHD